jgi:magnesium chelatase family protein
VQRRVEAALERALERSGCANYALTNKQIDAVCALDDAARQFLEQAMARLGLSARAYHRVLKVARTIADLGGAADIAQAHLAEAIQYRCLDRDKLIGF